MSGRTTAPFVQFTPASTCSLAGVMGWIRKPQRIEDSGRKALRRSKSLDFDLLLLRDKAARGPLQLEDIASSVIGQHSAQA